MNDTPEKQAAEPERLYYFLVAGEVIYTKNDKPFSIKLNCIAKMAVPVINRTQIARAQQTLQVRLYQEDKVNQKKIVVNDVFIYGFTLLGHMTEEEFAPPIPDNFVNVEV